MSAAAAIAALRRNKAANSPKTKGIVNGDDEHDMLSLFPAQGSRLEDVHLGQWLNGNWQTRRFVYTKEVVAFARPNEEILLDVIPLEEVTLIELMGKDTPDEGNKDESETPDGVGVGRDSKTKFQNAFQIRTEPEGHNSGRTYYLQADDALLCSHIFSDLNKLYKQARVRKENKGRFAKSQDKVRAFYDSLPFQSVAAFLIIANFVANAADAQLTDRLTNEDGSRTDIGDILDNMNVAFTIVFALELAINMYANLLRRFFSDGWNVFDLIVVTVSLVDLGPANLPVNYFRLMRAFRVVRIFGRFKALKKIISALTTSIVPMIHAFLIMFVVTCIYSIMGVTFFRELAPENFEVFDRSFVTMFRVTAGDTWVDSLPQLNPDGTMNAGTVSFIFSYILIVNWVLLQVSVAVLLDNFVSASADMDREEREKAFAEQKSKEHISNCLEPLLLRLAKGFIDDVDLSARLQSLFKCKPGKTGQTRQVLDSDGSGGLSSREFCAAMKKLDFKPRIYMSDSDFVSITNNLDLCDSNGDVGPKSEVKIQEFENIMRNQIRLFVQSRLADFSDFRTTEENEFTEIGALKLVLSEQLKSDVDFEETMRDVNEILQLLDTEEDFVGVKDPPGKLAKVQVEMGQNGFNHPRVPAPIGQQGRWRGSRGGKGSDGRMGLATTEEGADDNDAADPLDMEMYSSENTLSKLEAKLKDSGPYIATVD